MPRASHLKVSYWIGVRLVRQSVCPTIRLSGARMRVSAAADGWADSIQPFVATAYTTFASTEHMPDWRTKFKLAVRTCSRALASSCSSVPL